MQYVSKEYRQSMQALKRNKSYMRLYIGLINHDAQQGAALRDEGLTQYSDIEAPFDGSQVTKPYATYEQGWSSLDGSVYFIPRNGGYHQQGVVTEALADSKPSITIIFNTESPVDLKGMTIKFGKSYPTLFTITTDNKTVQFENNSQEFKTEETFNSTTYMTIQALSMSKGNTRLRIEQILCGIGINLDDNKIISAKLKSTISPIGGDMPTMDFTVKIENMDRYYNVDNDDSAINFIETGQELVVYWGYRLDSGDTEWFKGATLYMKSWSATDTTAKFEAVDVFEYMDDEYSNGEYHPEGISLYDLAEDVFEDAGMDVYWIDPYLKNITVYNPLPTTSHKQCLQLIANAGRCVLTQDNDGKIMIKSSFVPDVKTTSNGETGYSNVAGIIDNTDTREYASFEPDFTTGNGAQYFIPRNMTECFKTGYVSSDVSDGEGYFITNPTVTLNLEAAVSFFGMSLYFGDSIPYKFIIKTYNNGTVTSIYKSTAIYKATAVNFDFIDTDRVDIEFTQTKPHSRIHLAAIKLGEATDYTISYNDLLSTPTGTKLEKVKAVRVARTIYTKGTEYKDLVSDDITTPTEQTLYDFNFSNAVHDLDVVCTKDDEEIDIGAVITEQKAYRCRVLISNPPKEQENVTIVVRGYEYNTSTAYKTMQVNATGKILDWENPLISSENTAQDLAEWLGSYYASGNEYSLKFRGDPALEANDLAYLESMYLDELMIRLESIETDYSGSITGKITARRIV
jgi:hypothetical protein